MKILIHWYWWLIPLVIIWLFIGRTSISIKPFRIHVDAPSLVIGVILITMGVILVNYQIRIDAKNEAYEEVIKLIEEQQIKNLKTQ